VTAGARRFVCALLLLLLVERADVWAQRTEPVPEPVRIGGSESGPYAKYGTPVYVSLEALVEGWVPQQMLSGAIRTRGLYGVLGVIPPSRARAKSRGDEAGLGTDVPTYFLSGRDLARPVSLSIWPVPEIQGEFAFEAEMPGCREMEIVGTFSATESVVTTAPPTTAGPPTTDEGARGGGAFRFWSYAVLGKCSPSRDRTAESLTLEELVWGAQGRVGRTFRVRGQFRGGDLSREGDCRGAPSDGWLIKDGPFTVWVRDKKPRGPGWTLDPANRTDMERWVLVVGKLELSGECVILRASEVALASAPAAAQ